jgi:predicted negative regulator of RcsB-dependent stress response
MFEKKEYDEALKLLKGVASATHTSTNLRARAMMLLGRISQAQGNIDAAINNYVKIGSFFKAETELAAEGLWLGGQLLEQKANQ